MPLGDKLTFGVPSNLGPDIYSDWKRYKFQVKGCLFCMRFLSQHQYVKANGMFDPLTQDPSYHRVCPEELLYSEECGE